MDMGTVTGTGTKVDAGENMGTDREGDMGLNTRPKTRRILFFNSFI